MDMRGLCGGNAVGDRRNPRIKGLEQYHVLNRLVAERLLEMLNNWGQRSLLEPVYL
jgi:hypothetical protein